MSEGKSSYVRDEKGVAKFRHEAIGCILRAHPTEGLQVLLYLRERPPFNAAWSLPSGSVEPEESISESVLRHLRRRTGIAIKPKYMEQLETYSSPGRDPYDRTIATAYLGLVPWDSSENLPNAEWKTPVSAVDMAFDHHFIIARARERLQAKLSYSNIAYALAAETFTIAELRGAYRAVLGYDVAPTNLARVLTRRGQLEETGEMASPGSGGGRPAKLYRFTATSYEITDPFAAFAPR